MKLILLVLILLPSVGKADFADKGYVEDSDIVLHIIRAAKNYGDPLSSLLTDGFSYYLRRVEYVGPCRAPFGTIDVARLFFIRSAPKDSIQPARGHTFVVFLDKTLTVRSFWTVSHTLGQLSVSDTKLLLDNKILIDYSLDAKKRLSVDGDVQKVPRW